MRTLLNIMLLFILSCNKEKEIIEGIHWNILKVEGLTTGAIQQPIEIIVYWGYSSGCDFLNRFEESKTGNVIHIKAIGQTSSGICTTDAGIKTRIYTFTPNSTGIFEFRFINTDNSIITHIVTIN